MQPYNNNPYNNQGFNNGYSQPQQGWNPNMNNYGQYQNQGGQGGFYSQPVYGQQQQYGQQQYGQQQGFNNDPYTNNFSNNSFDGFTIPDNFDIIEKLMTLGMDMKLQVNGSQFGFIKQKVLSLGRTFQLQDNSGRVIAIAKQKLLSIGRDFDVSDGSGNRIGSIKQQVLKSMFSIHRKYTLMNASGAVVGFTKQLQLLSKGGVQITNSFGQPQARFDQTWSWGSLFKEKWDARFLSNTIDRRLVIFFPSISSERQESRNHN